MSGLAGRLALRAARIALRVPPLRRLARGMHEALSAERAFETGIPELTPIGAQPSARGPQLRLNLLLPGVSSRHLFGGAATALALFDALHRDEPRRILVTDETELEGLDPRRFAQWRQSTPEGADPAGGDPPVLVALADRAGRALPVHAGDRFVATAWWTAHLAAGLSRWQRQSCGLVEPAPFVYLIQDYEPGFYPWSTRYALAEATYGLGDEAITVFNTDALRRYVHRRHDPARRSFAFEPGLNPALAARLPRPGGARQRRVLVYGRPGVPRNAFALIVEGLRAWVAIDPQAARWEVVSVGETHPPVSLGRPPGAGAPLVMAARGKLSLDDYAGLMAESAIGLSLMLSPHPSYPPLEMAAFGMRVLTNRFEGKALAQQHSNVHDLEAVTPDAIAHALARLTACFERADEPWSQPPGEFALAGNTFAFAPELRDIWLGTS